MNHPGGAGGSEGRHGPGLGDALLQDLSLLRFLVGQREGGVHRLVELAEGGVDLHLGEERVHAERAGLVRDDRHDVFADLLVAKKVAQQAGHGHGRRVLALARAVAQAAEDLGGRRRQRLLANDPPG